MSEPVVPPKAENIIIRPDINPCFGLGKDVKMAELIEGYTGARKIPIKGNIKAASGASPHPVYVLPTVSFASGNATQINNADNKRQLMST